MEVIKFTSKIYAVKGTKDRVEAVKAVIRKRHKSLGDFCCYQDAEAYVGNYGKDELGLWVGGKNGKTNCIAVRFLK